MKGLIGKAFRYLSNLGNPRASSGDYVAFLRSKGVSIGDNVHFHQLDDVNVDVSRPGLISIGNDVRLTRGLIVLSHDYSWFVTRNRFGEVVGKSGRVVIGSNVFIGFNVTILPDTVIGDNVIIGAGSIVRGQVESDSVYAGSPARRIMSLEDYFEKRKERRLAEVIDYVGALTAIHGNDVPDELLGEEFPFFIDRSSIDAFSPTLLRKQLGACREQYLRQHQAMFESKADFLRYCREHAR